ncbi:MULTISPECIES: aspartate-alanine antiporter [Streptomyces]|uniref:aspartate-alanine antiporter n=1 Tax=Streptomyces TaxID=1883 RepID=UPI000D50BB98|nr:MULTISPECIES: aspartate-alanine antiporter [Streptomyces]MXG25723.1 aspartate-alanine antiporter [Streptomyces sp. YIM 132580]PVC64807.1 aspartate-alanine antiporter [Streptomyces sp. CS065A]
MIDFLNRNIFQPHPELLVFLVVALGFLLGKVRYRAIALGAVTGCLVAGLVLGAQFKVDIDDTVKNLFFIMFLFALGYRVGPQFFRGLKKDGLPQVVNAVVVCVTGLLVSWLFASLLGYGPGLGAGLMSGALTQSAAIGVAQDAIGTLPGLSADEVKTQENLVAVGYAVTYPLGTILCAMLLANVLPRLYRRDLAKESADLAAELDAPDESPDEGAGYYEVVLRAYRVDRPDLVGRSVAGFEEQQQALGRRVYLTGVRREGTVLEHDQSRTLRLGDTVAVSAIRGDLVDFDPRTHIGAEADDVGLLGYRTETLHVVASRKEHLGRTVGEVRREPFMVGVYIDKLYRAGAEFPYRLSTPLERGDTLILTGPERLVGPAGKALGKPVPTSFATDMVWVGLGIFLGGCIGIPALTAGGVPISLSTSGGGLIMGLVFGWIRGRYPTYGNVPPGAQWFMDTLGLCLFVAVVGINAGPGFTSGLSTAGWGLLVLGAVATVVPLIVGFLVGHYIQKIRFPVLMGVLAGGQTTTAAIGAVNETSKSQIPTLGYTIPYAVGNVLLTVWGAVIVILNH